MQPDGRFPRGAPIPPSRADRLYAENASGAMSVAKEAAVALDRTTQSIESQALLRQHLQILESRVVVLEVEAKSRSTQIANRTAVKLSIVGMVGGLIVGLILFAVQFATATKEDAVKQSEQAVDRKILNSRNSTEATYDEGKRDGANQLQAEINRQLADKGLVVMPNGTVTAKPPKSHGP